MPVGGLAGAPADDTAHSDPRDEPDAGADADAVAAAAAAEPLDFDMSAAEPAPGQVDGPLGPPPESEAPTEAHPVPAAQAMPRAAIDAAVDQAVAEAAQRGIGGKASTPFLLARVRELTGGDSLMTNIALVLNNARLGAAVAQALAAMHAPGA